MGLSDFWLQFNNGKKEQLGDTKSGIRKEQVDKKFHNLFYAYDTNQSEVLESNELEGIFKTLSVYVGNDKILDNNENKLIASIFGVNTTVQDIDFQGFVKSVSSASADIIESKETQLEDGGKEIFTTYKDGTKETVGYYPNGAFKYKKTEKMLSEAHYYVEINGQRREVNKTEFDDWKNKVALSQTQAKKPILADFNQFNISLIPDNFKMETMTEERPDIKYDFSGRAYLDIQARDFLLTHFIETHYGTQDALDTMGILDDIGAVINAGAGELWNACVNIHNKNFGNGTEKDYQDFDDLVKKFEPQYDQAVLMKLQAEAMQKSPELYFRNFETNFENKTGNKYNLQDVMQFQQLTEQYQVASVLSMRMDCLKKALNEVRMYQSTQEALTYNPVQSEGMNPAQHLLNAQEYLLQYFDNDKEAADLILNGTIGNADKTMEAIMSLLSDTELQLKDVLNKKEITLIEENGELKINTDSIGSYVNFEELKAEYQKSYKAMYCTDFVPDELTDKVMSAKATGGFVKIAAITIVSILITKSPAMANIMRASAGAVVDGASANFIRGLVSKYGQTVVQQGIKFAMSTGTLATDVGLTLLNQVTDNREGINGEEVWETTKGAAKYIYFGAFVGSPIAQAVTQKVGKLGIASKLFVNGTKTTQGAITTTSITGEQLVQNFMKASQSMVAKGAGFATDVAAFTLLDITTEDIAPGEALTSQAEMLTGLRIMHRAFEYMLGARTNTAMQKAKWEAAIEKSGVKNWNIKEIKTPTADGKGFKVVYDVDFNGIPLGKINDANALITAMMGKVSETYHAMETRSQSEVEEKVIRISTPINGKIRTSEELSIIDIITLYNEKMNNITPEIIETILKDYKTTEDKNLAMNVLIGIGQFADIKSFNSIYKQLKELNLTLISSEKNLSMSDIFSYLANKKAFDSDITYLSLSFENGIKEKLSQNKKIAIFLDITTLKEIENSPNLQKIIYDNPEKIKLILPDGWYEGITPFNHSSIDDIKVKMTNIIQIIKNEKTKLDKDINLAISEILNYDIKQKIESLNLNKNLLIIKNIDNPKQELSTDNISNLYSSTCLSESDLMNILSNYDKSRKPYLLEILAQTSKPFSMRTLAEKTKLQYEKILEKAKEKNIQEENIYYLVPTVEKGEGKKSYGMVSTIYRDTNNIPPEQFINDIFEIPKNKKTMLVILDDFSGSGKSLVDDYRAITNPIEILQEKFSKTAGKMKEQGLIKDENNYVQEKINQEIQNNTSDIIPFNSSKLKYNGPIIIAPLASTTGKNSAVENFKAYTSKDNNLSFMPAEKIPLFFETEYFKSLPEIEKRRFKQILLPIEGSIRFDPIGDKGDKWKSPNDPEGYNGFRGNATSIVFPYMAPNNNNAFYSSYIAPYLTLNNAGVKNRWILKE